MARKVYYYEKKMPIMRKGDPEWSPRLAWDAPPVVHKGEPPIRGLKHLDGDLHQGWKLADYQRAYGVVENENSGRIGSGDVIDGNAGNP